MEGGRMMLGKPTQGRAISLNDGIRTDGDAGRAKIVKSSRFVLTFGTVWRIAIAGCLATSLLTGFAVKWSVEFSQISVYDRRLVSPSSAGCALSVADGADNVSDPASHGAQGSGSPFHYSPRELNPGTWGTQA
jgi:hypothetical protein